jgi:xylulokinase
MVSRLTGENVFDHGLASTTMLYSLTEKTYDSYLLDAFGIEADQMPSIAEASFRAGTLHRTGAALTGLPQGLPVAVGTGDDFTNVIGTGETEPGRLICTVGTAEVVGALHHSPEIDPGCLVETHSYAGGKYFIENPGWFSGGAVTWLTGLLGLRSFQEMNDLAAGVPAGADGLLFLPALNGAMSPEWIPSARGCFYGLTPAHKAGHLARAVLEGCAFAMRDVAGRLTTMGVRLESLMLIGGGARSRLWGRIRSDISGLPVHIPEHIDTSAIGAALLAAVASDRYPDLAVCSEKIGAVETIIEPNPDNREPYNRAYADYRLLFDSLRPLYKTEDDRGGSAGSPPSIGDGE